MSIVKRDPYNGMRVVTNGCFDLFHEGHRYLMRYALSLCGQGALLILINSDRSVRELKGEGRPTDPFTIRAENIRSYVSGMHLQMNAYPGVIIKEFDKEEELARYINEFAPDIIVKGNDRTDVKDIVGSEKWPVVILPRLKGVSTTKMTEEINGKTEEAKPRDEETNWQGSSR